MAEVQLIQAQSGVSGTQKVEAFKVLISPPARGLCERVPPKPMCRQNLSRALVPRPFLLLYMVLQI
jgi:hypothetical protein